MQSGWLGPPSRVREADGWLWLEPRPAGLCRRRAVLAVVLVALTVVTLALTPRLDPALALGVVCVSLGVTGGALYRMWRVSWGRVGASALGVLLQGGGRSASFGWDALEGVRLRHRTHARVEVVLLVDGQPVGAGVTFGAREASEWARRAAASAPERVVWRSS